jgi:hypothetical protein
MNDGKPPSSAPPSTPDDPDAFAREPAIGRPARSPAHTVDAPSDVSWPWLLDDLVGTSWRRP